MPRRSARLNRCPFAGGTGYTSLLSHAAGALLPFLSTFDARSLRLVCREARAAVAAHPWEDAGFWSESEKVWVSGTLIGLPGEPTRAALARWRACFPHARGASLAERCDVSDADFAAHLRGMRSLDLIGCGQLTDATFAHLRGVRTLLISGCDQAGLTDAAFAHLRGSLRLLVCGDCPQLTDGALAHLRGIHTLVMWSMGDAITDAGLAHVAGVRTLVIGGVEGVSGAAFARLQGVERLLMWGCTGVEPGALRHLGGSLRTLDISYCPQMDDTVFDHLAGVRVLSLRGNKQLTGAALRQLRGLEEVDATGCAPSMRRAVADLARVGRASGLPP